MTDPELILRQLMIDGHEGAGLLAAFGRWLRALNGAELGVEPGAQSVGKSPVRTRRTQPDIVSKAFEVVPPPENAKGIGQKALNMAGLSAAAVAVGSCLLEHLNLKTGRCDPGRARLAEKAGVTVRHVHRVVNELVAAGLFRVDRHGGQGHRSAYAANWPELQRLVALGENRSLTREGQKSPVHGDKNVRQNLLRKPDSDSMVGRVPRGKRPAAPDRRQMTMVMPITGGRAKAEEAVRARLNRQLHEHIQAQHLPHDRAAFVRDMTASTSANWDAAITAEMARTGSGLPLLLADIDRATTDRKAG